MIDRIEMYYDAKAPDYTFETQLRKAMEEIGYTMTDSGFGFGERTLIFFRQEGKHESESRQPVSSQSL